MCAVRAQSSSDLFSKNPAMANNSSGQRLPMPTCMHVSMLATSFMPACACVAAKHPSWQRYVPHCVAHSVCAYGCSVRNATVWETQQHSQQASVRTGSSFRGGRPEWIWRHILDGRSIDEWINRVKIKLRTRVWRHHLDGARKLRRYQRTSNQRL